MSELNLEEPLEPTDIEIPSNLPVLPLKETVIFPQSVSPLAIGQERSVRLVDDVLEGERMLALVTVKNPGAEEPGWDDVYEIGTAAIVHKMIRVPDGTLRILVQGVARIGLRGRIQDDPYLVGEFEVLEDEVEETPELEALTRSVQTEFGRLISLVPYLPSELELAAANVDDPGALSHLVASTLRLKTAEKQALLEQRDVSERLRDVLRILKRELEVVELGTKIQSQVQSELEKGQREYVLRQQLKAIQEELGEFDESAVEAEELREQLAAIDLPEDVRTQADRELSRLENLPPQAAEHGVIRTYLEWIASLPWDKESEDNLDLKHAREVLDADHFALDQVKDRILEFLAVRKLKPDARGSILCFVGPPGVGKTSLGRSIARALGREFERISAGGVRDEAEIRGHRRTYIGAMPGTIIRALRDAGSRNPLFMIDEIDKMGADFRGDPASAMLEVLDPEQNSTFRDHYLDVPFDLSDVMFITTANTLDTIPGPLRDRMEIIGLAGYTEEEKLQIAKRYLVPRQIDRNGLKKSWITIGDKALRRIIAEYTREAGVRGLEREIGTICRKIARQIAEQGRNGKASIGEAEVRELLGKQRVFAETRRRTAQPGVATGLAWTPVGGDVLFIEAQATPGDGKLVITGQLGDVMRESAQLALTWVRGHHERLAPGVGDDWFSEHDIHLHVPAGATPKDGPSAGITMVTALASLVSGRCVRDDVAMTGEVTLTGQVLPIGGLKEKALAAQRAGIRTIICPTLNEGDVDDIPEHLRRKLEFRFVDRVDDVLELALE
jgi:ATP-dependent Lon protease